MEHILSIIFVVAFIGMFVGGMVSVAVQNSNNVKRSEKDVL